MADSSIEEKYNQLVNTGTISEKLSFFQEQMTKMDELFKKIETDTDTLSQAWEGSASDSVIASVREYKDVYEKMKAQNEKYVAELNVVMEKYIDFENVETKIIDYGNNTYDTNYIGKNKLNNIDQPK